MGTVLVYSDDATVRESVRVALGRRPAADLPALVFLEADDSRSLMAEIDAGGIDLAILDGEAWPAGGLGLARQIRDEVVDPPALLVITQRAVDAWLASWSRADAAVSHPLDPVVLTEAAVRLLRERAARPRATPVPRGLLGLLRHG